MRLAGLLFCALGLVLAAPAPAGGVEARGEPVAVRAAAHRSFSRLVLEWASPIQFERRDEEGRLVLRFARPFTADFAGAVSQLSSYVQSIDLGQDARELRLGLKGGVSVRLWHYDPRLVIIDLSEPAAFKATVPVRAGIHTGFVRIVFDWPYAVSFQAHEEPGVLAIAFPDPATIEAGDVLRRLGRWVEDLQAAAEGSGTSVRLHLKPGLRAKVFSLERDKVVVDILPVRAPQEPSLAGRAPPGAEFGEAGVSRAAGTQEVARAAAQGPERTAALAADGRTVRPGFAPRPKAKPAPGPHEPSSASAASAMTAGSDQRGRTAGRDSARVDTNAQHRTPGDAARPAVAGRTQAPSAAVPGISARAIGDQGVEIRFAWPEAVPAAVFVRANALWVAFAAPAGAAGVLSLPLDPGLERFMGPGERIEAGPDALIARFPLRKTLEAAVTRQLYDWHIKLLPQAEPPALLPLLRLSDPARLRTAGQGGKVVTVVDPDVGDELQIWPVIAPGIGLPGPRSFVDLQFLPSAQGLAWRPLSDALDVRPVEGGIEFGAPEGLHLSTLMPEDAAAVRAAHDGVTVRAEGTAAEAGRTLAGGEAAAAAPPRPAPAKPTIVGRFDQEAGEEIQVPILAQDDPGRSGSKPAGAADRRAAQGAAAGAAPPRMDANTGGERAQAMPQQPAVGENAAAAKEDLEPREASPSPAQGDGREIAGTAVPPAGTAPASPLGLARFALAPGETVPGRLDALQRALEDAPAEAVPELRLDLARFYLAQTMAADALAALKALPEQDLGGPESQARLARKALTGAAHLLLGRVRPAADALSDPLLDGDAEVELWRAALAAAQEQWADAADALARSAAVLESYPDPLQLRLGVPVALIQIEAGSAKDTFGVLRRLARLDLHPVDRARLTFLHGLAHYRLGAIDEADSVWQRLENSQDQETRIKAVFMRTTMLLDHGRIGVPEALERLEASRAFWPGHPWEVVMLDRLAELHAEAGDALSAVRTWQDAIHSAPEVEGAEELAKRARTMFEGALRTEGDGPLGPVRALALVRDFPGLMPAGEAGVRLRRDLASRVAAFDLIEPAAALLSEVLEASGSDGGERAQAGADLAALWLQASRPQSALKALEDTGGAGAALPRELAARRELLKAQALLNLQRVDEALALLEGRTDQTARELRAAALWEKRDWAGLVRASRAALPSGSATAAGLSPEQQKIVVRLALAYAKLQDGGALAELRSRFDAAMRGSDAEAAFRMLTATTATSSAPAAVLSAAGREIESLRSFLEADQTRPP